VSECRKIGTNTPLFNSSLGFSHALFDLSPLEVVSLVCWFLVLIAFCRLSLGFKFEFLLAIVPLNCEGGTLPLYESLFGLTSQSPGRKYTHIKHTTKHRDSTPKHIQTHNQQTHKQTQSTDTQTDTPTQHTTYQQIHKQTNTDTTQPTNRQTNTRPTYDNTDKQHTPQGERQNTKTPNGVYVFTRYDVEVASKQPFTMPRELLRDSRTSQGGVNPIQ